MASIKKENNIIFINFIEKAAKRLEDRKALKTRRLFVPSLDQEITIRALTTAELAESLEMEKDNGDPAYADKYCVYISVVEPCLKDVALELKDAGKIRKYLEVVDIFEISERNEIALQIMELSGAVGGAKVTVVDELKN